MSKESVCEQLLPKGMSSCLRKTYDATCFEVGLDAQDSARWQWKRIDAKTWPKARKLAPAALADLMRASSASLVERANGLIKSAGERDAAAGRIALAKSSKEGDDG